MNHIIEETKILDGFIGLEKNEFDLRLLSKSMKYRNAFTHGTFSTDGNAVWLDYYEGGPAKIELTDEYLAKLHHEVSRAIFNAFLLAGRLGAIQSAEASAPSN